ncbi:hypothetical protein SODALDRAFT_374895 [Sodiomyces alkalinus F11]|uniref:Uncharacterized protein n=1 Tax=Sodiomyces alkalinus (strain CBS 110278 / VKM F-3762 / F11) TaxID=1314773 RepID=A0A3N2Q7C4_SODAK|nr:hypothetical protein SODALDRAFT_374895 [Sodiomyces alkalinus F11]ROT42587.1 hypothetical protein SODALDRAFT_374895 [Sodiomyces alkalinus F11]
MPAHLATFPFLSTTMHQARIRSRARFLHLIAVVGICIISCRKLQSGKWNTHDSLPVERARSVCDSSEFAFKAAG